MELNDRQREFLQFLAGNGKVDVREVNAVMGWSDEELRATVSPLTEAGLAALTLSITAKLADASPGSWGITNRGREALGVTRKPV